MSWRVPKFPLLNTRVTDLEDLNANFFEYVEELGGSLNEHNWSGSVGTPSARAITAVTDIDPSSAFVWHSASQYVDYTTLPTNAFLVESTISWVAVSSTTISLSAPACTLMLWASWQLHPTAPNTPNNTPLPSFALRVNGQIISESIIGSVEVENDPLGGLGYGVWPQGTNAIIPLPSGTHTVELVVKTLAFTANFIYVGSREVVALEMRRGR